MCGRPPKLSLSRAHCVFCGRFELLRKLFLQSYGYEHLVTLDGLARAGLFHQHVAGAGHPFSKLRSRLRLIPSEDVGDPATQVLYGYSPLSAAVIERMLSDAPTDDWAKLLAHVGPVSANVHGSPPPAHRGLALLYFIGGVTHSELAALRHVARRLQRRVVIATTHVVSGKGLMQSCMGPA